MLIAIVIIFIVFIAVLFATVSYQVDRDANKESIRVTYKEFVKLFKNIKWNERYFKGCLEDKDSNSEIWCSDFIIGGQRYWFKNYFEWLKWEKFYNGIKNYGGYNTKISFEEESNNRLIAEKRLTTSLKTLCEQLSIPLTYHDNLGDAAGRILYSKLGGRILLDDAKIEILNSNKETPWVLAHELGHYMALKQRGDNSEAGANAEAHKLCKSILNEKENKELESSMKIYFE